ncbi:thiopeptide-type bacteriocin biosynthesis protein [Actinocorallia populi]|uniref:thiopeptide-type bacteriocin biosynthesis protein n=1 Tax=Actinocorallia populi TaxID=2079200 RepID=UPI000D08F6DF|nr:thiopeptide-type bacteriocin biosynthesis protein [Actinocorallia populi]
MPADHLTSPTRLTDAVRAVLAGTDTASAAASYGTEAADLDDAVTIYHAAGTAALEQRASDDWFQVRAELTDWTKAETVGAFHLGPRLDELTVTGAITGWWFLRKHPCWRLRLHHADPHSVTEVLDELTAIGRLAGWQPSLYEPETAAFGGPTAMGIIHDLFCGDTAGVLDYLRQPAPAVGRREMSLLLLGNLLHAAGLDSFERGDVFARTARLRPPPDPAALAPLIDNVRAFLSIPDPTSNPLFSAEGDVGHATGWLAAYTDAGRRLRDAAAQGHLERGLRAVLSHIVIFHWNRLGLSTDRQGILASAAAAALLPPD